MSRVNADPQVEKKYSPVESKKRLDVLLVERGLVRSRELARRVIMAGQVRVEDRPVVQPGTRVGTAAQVQLQARCPYVGRGGTKLAAALARFGVAVSGWVIADIGASTGGFTDCVLQHGARRVYAIDVGYGQLDWTLRQDPRVIVRERVNARYLLPGDLPERVALVTVDVAFISLTLVLPGAMHILQPGGQVIALVKPQFEAGRQQVGRGGVVRDRTVHGEVLRRVMTWARTHGLRVRHAMPSPITGTDGNVEFFLHLCTDAGVEQDMEALIAACLAEAQACP